MEYRCGLEKLQVSTLALCNNVEGVQILLTLPPGVSSAVLVKIAMEMVRLGGNC